VAGALNVPGGGRDAVEAAGGAVGPDHGGAVGDHRPADHPVALAFLDRERLAGQDRLVDRTGVAGEAAVDGDALALADEHGFARRYRLDGNRLGVAVLEPPAGVDLRDRQVGQPAERPAFDRRFVEHGGGDGGRNDQSQVVVDVVPPDEDRKRAVGVGCEGGDGDEQVRRRPPHPDRDVRPTQHREPGEKQHDARHHEVEAEEEEPVRAVQPEPALELLEEPPVEEACQVGRVQERDVGHQEERAEDDAGGVPEAEDLLVAPLPDAVDLPLPPGRAAALAGGLGGRRPSVRRVAEHAQRRLECRRRDRGRVVVDPDRLGDVARLGRPDPLDVAGDGLEVRLVGGRGQPVDPQESPVEPSVASRVARAAASSTGPVRDSRARSSLSAPADSPGLSPSSAAASPSHSWSRRHPSLQHRPAPDTSRHPVASRPPQNAQAVAPSLSARAHRLRDRAGA
jgi:hypothetical protein